jgi:adenine phosphoribosyltransferase
VINGEDAALLKNKKVIIIDDVISTGVTMRMISHLMDKLNAEVVGYFAALKQGVQFDEIKNLTFFEELPIVKLN